MGIPHLWCGIEFKFLPGTLIMHQTAYRKHFVEHGRKRPVHPMTVTPHLSPPSRRMPYATRRTHPTTTSPGTASTAAWQTGW